MNHILKVVKKHNQQLKDDCILLKDDCILLKDVYLKSLKGIDKQDALEKGRIFYKRCKYVENVEDTETTIQNDLSLKESYK